MRHRYLALLAPLACAILIGGCGGSDVSTTTARNSAGAVDETQNPQYKEMLDQMKTKYVQVGHRSNVRGHR